MAGLRLFEECRHVAVNSEPDGRGGADVSYTVLDQSFMAAFAEKNSEERQAGGAEPACFYEVLTAKGVELEYGVVYYRTSNGAFFRASSEPVPPGRGVCSAFGSSVNAVVLKNPQ